MPNSNESFRNELITKLLTSIPQEQILSVLPAIDATLANYNVSYKPVEIISSDGIPEAVKCFIASKAVKNLSKGTLKVYNLRLTDFFCMVKKPVQDITSDDIRMYLYYYKSSHNASNAYLDAIRRILNSFFEWLINNGYLLRNPCSNVERIKFQPAERIPLSTYDLEVLRWNCHTLREKAMIDFFFATGVRLSELRDVNKSDIDWDKRSVIIRHGKGDKRRTVFFNAEAELSLQKYLESRTDNNDALFVSCRKPYNRLCNKSIEDAVAKIADRVGMHVYPHKLRHTFATIGIRSGMSLENLQALMGHAKPETTTIYAHLCEADLQREHAKVYL